MKAIASIFLVFILVCIISVRLSITATAPSPDNKATVYTIGVVPQFEQRKLYAVWSPIVAELSRRTGLRFKLVTTLTIENFEKEFALGSFDFVYMNLRIPVRVA